MYSVSPSDGHPPPFRHVAYHAKKFVPADVRLIGVPFANPGGLYGQPPPSLLTIRCEFDAPPFAHWKYAW
jgi:hypothetical protein